MSNIVHAANNGKLRGDMRRDLTIDGNIDLKLADSHYNAIFKEMMKRFSYHPTMRHQCNSCGGTLELNADKHIFSCPYCGSTYAIGTINLNS